MAKQKIVATEEMLKSLKRAVQAYEDSWDAQRDFELEAGRDFDGLSHWVEEFAVVGAESVDLESVQQLLDSFTEENEQ